MEHLAVHIGIAISILTFIWTVYQYMDKKKREQDLKEFENFHKLIKELVQPDNVEKDIMYVDRQTAIVYELRHFKRYYPFSYRTLKGLRKKWAEVPNQYPRLIDEIDRTLSFLEKKVKESDLIK